MQESVAKHSGFHFELTTIVEEMECLWGSPGTCSGDSVGYEAEIAQLRQSLEKAKARCQRVEQERDQAPGECRAWRAEKFGTKSERGKGPSIELEAGEPTNEVAEDHPADESAKESTGGESVKTN